VKSTKNRATRRILDMGEIGFSVVFSGVKDFYFGKTSVTVFEPIHKNYI